MILALDIAFANLGWVVFDKGEPVAWGVISTEPTKKKNVMVSDDYAGRCMDYSSQLITVIQRYKPKGIVGELPHGSQSASSAKLLGGAVGIVCAVATMHGMPCEWISEGDSKKASLGVRAAKKEMTMDWARSRYPDKQWPKTKGVFEHIADALMAYCGLKNGILIRTFG